VTRVQQQHVRLALITFACGLFVALVIPLNLGIGANAEEAVGLIDVAPERLYPPGVDVPSSERGGAAGLRTSNELPVWGYQREDGSYLPLMIDGHVGALPFYIPRFLARSGGIYAARLHSTVLAAVAILLIFSLARRLGGDRVGIVAALLAGTSPHLLFVFSMVRPDEQLHSFAHLAALLALIGFAANRRTRWLYLACFLLGLGIAAKNTALWALVALVIAGLCFRLVPRLRPRDWAIGAGLFLLPLVPQLLYLVLSDSAGAMSSRAAMVSAPWESLAPSGLAASVSTFASSVGHGGTLVGGYIAGTPGGAPVLPGVGYLLFTALLVVVAGTFALRNSVKVRAFGAGLGLLLLQHLAFYYRGEAYFELLAPWIPIAVALAGLGLWEAAGRLSASGLRASGRALVVAAGLLIFANNGLEIRRYHVAASNPQPAMFNGAAQLFIADILMLTGIERPYVTTYGQIGVYELHTHGRVRPRHLFPYFQPVADGGAAEYRAAWVAILRRLGPGHHVFVLSANSSPVETSPCVHGEQIARQLWPAVRLLGGRMRALAAHHGQNEEETLVVARVTLFPSKPTRR